MKSRKSKRKLAIVMSGGGMQCVYGAGVLTALAEHYHITDPDILIAASGSASSAAYYLAKQYEKISLTWIALSQDPKFISMLKRPIVNVDYLVDEILGKRQTLDYKRMQKSKTKLLFPVLRARDGALTYLKAPKNMNILKEIRATLAAPVVFGKKVKIRGRYYIDGAYGPTVHDYMYRAVKEKAKTIIAINSQRGGYSEASKALLRASSSSISPLRQKKSFARFSKEALKKHGVFIPPNDVNVIMLEPKAKLPVSFLGGTRYSYRAAFNAGYEDTIKNPNLEKLLRP